MRGVAATFLVALSLLPTARAAPLCSNVTEQPPNTLGAYVVLSPLNGGTQVYLESNGQPGLQRQACEPAPGADPVPADTLLLDVGGVRAEAAA